MSYNDAAEYTSDPGVYGIRTSGYSQFAMKPIPKDGTEGTVLGIYGLYEEERFHGRFGGLGAVPDLGEPYRGPRFPVPESLLSEAWIERIRRRRR